MASPQLQPIIDMLKNRPIRTPSIEETRAGFEMLAQMF